VATATRKTCARSLRTGVQKSPAYDEIFLEQCPMGSVMGHVSRHREEKGSAKGTVVIATRRTRGEGGLRGVNLSRLFRVPMASLQLSMTVIVGKQDQATTRIVPGWRPPSPTSQGRHRNHIVPGFGVVNFRLQRMRPTLSGRSLLNPFYRSGIRTAPPHPVGICKIFVLPHAAAAAKNN